MQPVSRLHQLHNLLLPTLQHPLHLPTRITANGGTVSGSEIADPAEGGPVGVIQTSPDGR